MLSKIKSIKQTDYNGDVYDLSFNSPTYFYVQHIDSKVNTYIKIKNCDIDWDSEMGGREQVLEYLIETYGQNQVCNVATFGLYAPKSALQDMSRGLRKETGLDSILMRKICKLPEVAEEGVNKWKPKPGEMIQYFKEIRRTNLDSDILNWIDNNQDTIKLADKLVGQMKNLGTHAGGIVVTPEPIYNFIPVTRGSGNLITAFKEADGSSKDLSDLGILKLDVLGLKTLNILKECVTYIKEQKGIDLFEKIYYLPLDDQKIIDMFASGNNFGVFQMERSKMFTSRFESDGGGIDSFNDIVAINAMNRPGPLEKFLPKYGYWKAIDKDKIKLTNEELDEANAERYPFEFMKPALSPTYGCLDKDEKIYIPATGYYKSIKDMLSGDEILSINRGRYSRANNKSLVNKGNKDIFEYTFATGYTLRVTKDHKVNTMYGEMEIGDAYRDNISVMMPRELEYSIHVPVNISSDCCKARLIGLMLADGNFKSTNTVFTNSNEDLLNWFETSLLSLYPETEINKYLKKNNTFDYVISGKVKRKNAFREELKNYGLLGKGSRNKFIPAYFFTSPKEVKLNLLAGLWDGDGAVNKFNAYYRTKSKQLAEDIVLLCRQLGMLPVIKPSKDGAYRILLNFKAYSEIAQYVTVDYKKQFDNLTDPYYNQIDKKFLQEKMREFCGSERAFNRLINFKRSNAGGHFKDQNFVSIACDILGLDEEYNNNYFVKLTGEEFIKNDEVYDLSIDGEPWFVAGAAGILVHNCLLFQEQFMQMISDVTGMTFGEADSFRRAIAWRPDNPKFHTVKGYFDRLEQSMLDKGYTKEDADKFLQYCRDFMGYSFNKCFSGDEKIYRFSNRKDRFYPTIGEMYKIKNDINYAKRTGHYDLRKKYNKYGYGVGFSLKDGVLIKNKIVDIRFEGIKPIHRVTLESGKTIDVTMNHKFPTNNGEKKLMDIVVGFDKIFVNAGYEHIDRVYRFNTGQSNLPVTGQKGFQTMETNFTELQRKSVMLLETHVTCIKCPSKKKLEVHHIDGDHGNQTDENLTVLCSSCHKKEHYSMGRTKVGEKGLLTKLENITKIEFLKNDEVYDIEMAAPSHSVTLNNGIVASNSHSAVYSYITWQTLYFKVYYPSYFYAATLNTEKEADEIQKVIEDAKKNGIDILPLSISKSVYNTVAETDTAIRLGYRLIKGMGDAVQTELKELNLSTCRTIDEVLQKPFKKINASALQNLITLGCFDEFGVERAMIIKIKELYKEPKIEKWFSRKRSPVELKTMPDILKESFEEERVMEIVEQVKDKENPHIELVKELTPFLNIDSKDDEQTKKIKIQKETIQAELSLLGFSITVDDDFNQFAKSMRSGGFISISEYDGERPCYFKIAKMAEAKTKTGKTYWVPLLNDGRKDFKVKMWRKASNIVEGAFCVGVLENNEYGWTLAQCEFVK